MELSFKKWLIDEEGTSTACIANFARPVMGMVSRNFPDMMTKKKKKKKKRK